MQQRAQVGAIRQQPVETRLEPGPQGPAQRRRHPRHPRPNPRPQHRQHQGRRRPPPPRQLRLHPRQRHEARGQVVRRQRVFTAFQARHRMVVDLQQRPRPEAVPAHAGHRLHRTPPLAEAGDAGVDHHPADLQPAQVGAHPQGVQEHALRHVGVALRLELQVQQHARPIAVRARQFPDQVPVSLALGRPAFRVGRHGRAGHQAHGRPALQFGALAGRQQGHQVPGRLRFGEDGLGRQIVGEGRRCGFRRLRHGDLAESGVPGIRGPGRLRGAAAGPPKGLGLRTAGLKVQAYVRIAGNAKTAGVTWVSRSGRRRRDPAPRRDFLPLPDPARVGSHGPRDDAPRCGRHAGRLDVPAGLPGDPSSRCSANFT